MNNIDLKYQPSEEELHKLEDAVASEPCPHCGRSCKPSIALSQRSNSGDVFSFEITCCCERRKNDLLSFLNAWISKRRIPRIPW